MRSLVADRESLVAELQRRGVTYLAPSDALKGPPIDDEILISSLALHADPRLRQALIAIFLLSPRLSALVPRIRDELKPAAALALTAHYMAAVYLQRMWSVRLEMGLGELAELPDLYSNELGLPAPAEYHGKPGLHALAEWHAQQSEHPFNHLSEYHGVADLLFETLESGKDLREPERKR